MAIGGRWSGRVALALCASALSLLGASPAAAAPRAEITRSAHGVPNIEAKNYEGLGYGYGYAFAQDNICIAADMYVTVSAQRSRFFGPSNSYRFRGNGTRPNNLNSDFFYQRIIDHGTVESLLARKPPQGPLPEIRDGVRGYVKGYNAYLEDVGRDDIPDPACRGETWVRKIKPIDAYRRFYQLALLASQGVAINEVATAVPPTPPPAGSNATARRAAATVSERERSMVGELAERLPIGGIGSNASALGKQATQQRQRDGARQPALSVGRLRALLPVAPDDPGQGQRQRREPVRGAARPDRPHREPRLEPHCVDRFPLHAVRADARARVADDLPGRRAAAADAAPTSVTVQVPRAGGGTEPRTRTLYCTEYGPMINGILGLPLFPWTPIVGYSMGDVNADNFRYLNHFFATNRAQIDRRARHDPEALRRYPVGQHDRRRLTVAALSTPTSARFPTCRPRRPRAVPACSAS